jgi:hypothetical protein
VDKEVYRRAECDLYDKTVFIARERAYFTLRTWGRTDPRGKG